MRVVFEGLIKKGGLKRGGASFQYDLMVQICRQMNCYLSEIIKSDACRICRLD